MVKYEQSFQRQQIILMQFSFSFLSGIGQSQCYNSYAGFPPWGAARNWPCFQESAPHSPSCKYPESRHMSKLACLALHKTCRPHFGPTTSLCTDSLRTLKVYNETRKGANITRLQKTSHAHLLLHCLGVQPRPKVSAYKAHVFGMTAMNAVIDGLMGLLHKSEKSKFPAEFALLIRTQPRQSLPPSSDGCRQLYCFCILPHSPVSSEPTGYTYNDSQ